MTSSSTNNEYAGSLNEELPPAYTPGPDRIHGETTVEHGPSRPFQPAPQHTGASTASQWPPQPTVNYTGQQIPPWNQQHGSLSVQSTGQQWNYPQQTGSFAPPPGPPPQAIVSDFAHDFYAAGSGHPVGDSNVPSTPTPGDNARASDYPTTTPVPGHPLLNNGKLLIYPRDYLCSKCQNTGYRQNDPTNPCKKCWSKWAKPFTGALTYAFAQPSETDRVTDDGARIQRALPILRPPQSQPHFAPPSQPHFAPPSQPHFAPPSQSHYPPPPPIPPQISHHPTGFGSIGPLGGFSVGGGGGLVPHPTSRPNIQLVGSRFRPPMNNNSLILRAGDPRIGGRACWECGGSGRISLLIFDAGTCPTCGGVGRQF